MKFEWKGKELYIDGYLASALDSLIYNITEDWDFVILITGDRKVRVGKSVLAMTCGAYLAWALEKRKLNPCAYSTKDIYFDSSKMVDQALTKGKYYINHYDEARESLAASKSLQKAQQDVIDFFNECGQLNHIFILVLPDFFTLKEEIAVARSELLLNVYRSDTKKMVDLYGEGEKRPVVSFDRGRFQGFGKERKDKLYDIARAKHIKNYNMVKADFIGRFTNQWPLDREEYEKMKKDSLARFKARHKKLLNKPDKKSLNIAEKFLDIASFHTHTELEKMSRKVGKHKDYFRENIYKLKKYIEEGEYDESDEKEAQNEPEKTPVPV